MCNTHPFNYVFTTKKLNYSVIKLTNYSKKESLTNTLPIPDVGTFIDRNHVTKPDFQVPSHDFVHPNFVLFIGAISLCSADNIFPSFSLD